MGQHKDDNEIIPEAEIARRRDEVIRRMASTPPRPHKEMKIGKRKAKAADKESTGKATAAKNV